MPGGTFACFDKGMQACESEEIKAERSDNSLAEILYGSIVLRLGKVVFV